MALKGHCVHRELTKVKLPVHTVEQKEPWTSTRPGTPGQPDPFCSEVTKRLMSLGALKEGNYWRYLSRSPYPNWQMEGTVGYSSYILLENPGAKDL